MNRAEVQLRVDAVAHAHHLRAVGQVALHHFLVRPGEADVGHVGQAHDVGEVVQALAQMAAQVAAVPVKRMRLKGLLMISVPVDEKAGRSERHYRMIQRARQSGRRDRSRC
ncbi:MULTISPECIES: hypothetical protein [Massilia]|uniref:hypothetical protein n=1 Tax=Massilia TaxID=149698 RepID=UPI000EBF8201|nr:MULTISPECIES: hypothetical protein [Massilia]QYG03076.1 hypothetical protein KY496_06660 [Massilia sp. NP310]HAK90783.1 hypothetical protein [Massilia timonae]